ncbi:hypothetical protein [Armatimonas sp.]|uniref:hypothetical protein n=1 Tax=Armatimonas sp. TaxID=1872638 RepID=UPI00374CF64E
MSEMSHDGAAYLVVLFSIIALVLVPFGIRLLRQKRPIGLIFTAPLVLAIGCWLYMSLSFTRPVTYLYTDAFQEPPDTTITDLKAYQRGVSGYYHGYVQFHAPPETFQRLKKKVVDSIWGSSSTDNSLGWGEDWKPDWFHASKLPGRSWRMKRSVACVGHFGLTFYPDTCELRYFEKENLVQVHWGYYD